MTAALTPAELARIAEHAGASPRHAFRARQRALRERAQLETLVWDSARGPCRGLRIDVQPRGYVVHSDGTVEASR